jgi:hypothetical protein
VTSSDSSCTRVGVRGDFGGGSRTREVGLRGGVSGENSSVFFEDGVEIG